MNLDAIPLWAFFFGTIALIVGSIEAGYAFGKFSRRRSDVERPEQAAAMVGAVLGLVAFMMAFTFSIASGRFDARKGLVRDDANAIGTAWLRADFLPGPERVEARKLLTEYLDVRINVAKTEGFKNAVEGQVRSAEIHRRLWEIAVAHGKRDSSGVGALVVDSMNAVFDIHAVRVAVAVDTRIPLGIWVVLYTISALGMMSAGYVTAISGSTRTRTGFVASLAFSLIITLIAALDRPNSQLVLVTQKPLLDLREAMNSP